MLRAVFVALFGLFLAGALPPTVAGAGDQEDRLVLRGYDTVAYFTESRARAGDPHHEYEFDGAVYRFATAEHLALFKADPEKYLPQFGNLCTASLSRGVQVVADPNNWYIHEGRLHVFGKPIGPGLMQSDADGMEQRARQHFAQIGK